jgi:hypothetical protein
MTLLGFKTILHKKCRSGKNSESSKMKTNFKKSGQVKKSEIPKRAGMTDKSISTGDK